MNTFDFSKLKSKKKVEEESDSSDDEEVEDLNTFNGRQFKKDLIQNNYFPIYTERRGIYQLDTFFVPVKRIVKNKEKKGLQPYLLAVLMNYRIGFLAPFPKNYYEGRETRSGDLKDGTEKTSISVSSAGAKEALQKILKQIEKMGAFLEENEKMRAAKKLLKFNGVQVDKGGEFQGEFASYLGENNYTQYTVDPKKATKRQQGIVERLIRTLRQDENKFRKTDFMRFRRKSQKEPLIYKKRDVKKSKELLTSDDQTTVLDAVMQNYNFKARSRYAVKILRYVKKKAEDENLKKGTLATPVNLLSLGEEGEKQIIKYHQEKSKKIADYWEPRVEKIKKEGAYPIKFEDSINAFAKVTKKDIGSLKTDGKVHKYRKNGFGEKKSLHVDGKYKRSLKFSRDGKKYLPYDLFLKEDRGEMEKNRKNLKRRVRDANYTSKKKIKKENKLIKKLKKASLM